MQAENRTTEHNRTIRISGIKGHDFGEILITVGYVHGENEPNRTGKAIALDNAVIPELIRAINESHWRDLEPVEYARW